jgi:peptide/nickel transport system permease protein
MPARLRRDPIGIAALAVVVFMVGTALAAPTLRLPDPSIQEAGHSLRAPGAPGHPLGTDQFGRDLLSRLVWGGRISIAMGFAASAIAVSVGVPLGMVSGYLGGALDTLIMRCTDMMLAFPYLLLALVIVAVRGPGLGNALLAVAITSIPFYVRVTRGIVVTVAHQLFVEAALALGATAPHVLRRAILPAMMPYITVAFSMNVGWIILSASGLSFLGLGAQPPTPEWGAMLAEGRSYLFMAPYLVLLPGAVIFVLVLGFNIVGDLLQDAFNVELRDPASGS